jgi:cyclophilin family peptidyl-prolyl cis-trans isomerase
MTGSRQLASEIVHRRAALVFTMLTLVATGCGGDDSSDDSSAAASGCTEVEAPEARDPETLSPPESALADGKSYGLRFQTSCGEFTVTLTPDVAPKASASLVSLAEQGFFDDTIFHRIVPGFVIQGGDPTQTGGGGPGYTTVDPPPADTRYVKGTVAMAKAADESPGAAGSQFFVVTADDAQLPADYAVVGTVTGDDLAVVERIGELGDAAEQPTQTVLVEKVSVVDL